MRLFHSIVLSIAVFAAGFVHNSFYAQADTSMLKVQDSASIHINDADSVRELSNQGNAHVSAEETRYDGEPKEMTVKNKTFEFYLLLFILIVFGVIRLIDGQVYSSLFKRFLNTSLSARPVKNIFQQIQVANYLLIVLFFLISGLYLYYIFDRWHMHPQFLLQRPEWLQMLFYIGSITVAYVVKLSLLGMIGYVFDMKKFTSEYAFNILLVQQVLGIILFPFLWMIVFMGENVTKIAIIVSVTLFLLTFLNRYARSRESITSLLKLNKFHFFIYLCTSEIIPLLIIIKIMIG